MIYNMTRAPHTFTFDSVLGSLTIDDVELDCQTAWQLLYWMHMEHEETLYGIVLGQALASHDIDTIGEVPGDAEEPPF